jgi:hypothetical protein
VHRMGEIPQSSSRLRVTSDPKAAKLRICRQSEASLGAP